MPMRKTTTELADELTTAIKNFVKAEIAEAKNHDPDSMGSWSEERVLEETINDILDRLV